MTFRRLLLIATTGLCLTNASLAQEAESVTTSKKNRQSLPLDSSERLRYKKNGIVTGEVGFAVGAIATSGVTAGAYLNRNNIIQVNAAAGKLDILWFSIKATTASLSLKHFFGNSFYARAGAGYREIELRDRGLLNYAGDTEIGKTSSAVADVAIGNHWQWDNFTLGCDWFGAMVPVATISTSYDNTGYGPGDRAEADKNWDNLAKTTSYQLLRFYIGASF